MTGTNDNVIRKDQKLADNSFKKLTAVPAGEIAPPDGPGKKDIPGKAVIF